MTWLITGGCGFVGTNLVDALLAKGDDVVILDNLSRLGSRDNLAWLRSRHGEEWRFIEADIRDSDIVTNLIKETQPHALAHLAGQVAMTTSLQNPRLDFEINVLGSVNVLEAVRLHSPSTIVLYSSTNKVYGGLDWVRYEEQETRYIAPDYLNGFDETTALSFHSPYGCSKGAADQYMLDYARMFGLHTVVFRHSSMYGGRQFSTYDQGWIGWFCQKAIETKQAQQQGLPMPIFTISGNGKQVRDILHSDDLITIYLQVVESINIATGKVYNIGGGYSNSLSLLELFDMVENLLGIILSYQKSNWRLGDQKVFISNTREAHNDLNWFPKIEKKTGIHKMIEWVKNNATGN